MLGKRVWRVSQGIKDYCNDNPLISHVFLNTTTLQLLSLRTKRVINISQNRPLPNFQNHLLTVFSSSFYSNLSQSSICPKALKIVRREQMVREKGIVMKLQEAARGKNHHQSISALFNKRYRHIMGYSYGSHSAIIIIWQSSEKRRILLMTLDINTQHS